MFTRVFIALSLACAVSNVDAAIIVTFDSTSISANQTGYVDVWVQSSNTDALKGFDAYFRIVTPPTANGTLVFAPTGDQPNSQTLFGSEYVLYGGVGLDPSNFGAIRISTAEIELKDTLNSNHTILLETTRRRLARFALIHSTADPTLSHGDTFEIRMFPNRQDLSEDTVFFDSTDDRFIDLISFTNSGAIRVTAGGAAVPEPSTAIASAIGLLAFGTKRLRMRTRNKLASL